MVGGATPHRNMGAVAALASRLVLEATFAVMTRFSTNAWGSWRWTGEEDNADDRTASSPH